VVDKGHEIMSGAGVRQSPEPPDPHALDPIVRDEQDLWTSRKQRPDLLRLLWERRSLLFRAAVVGLLLSSLVAFLIPKSYTSTAQLMPPDSQPSSSLAMMAALAGKAGGGLSGLTGDLLGLKSSGALFIGVMRSQTAEDHIVQQFDLQKIFGKRFLADARKKLDENTEISEDRKSGIITISVTDQDPRRAAAVANAYIDELNSLIAQLSTSAAHREREFLEDRLKVAKADLDNASNQLAQFSSRNNTLDIQTEGKAMLDAAGTLAGQLIASESELQGLRQIYTDKNARVRALSARVDELRKQLEKLGGTPQNSDKNEEQTPNSPSIQIGSAASENLANAPFPTIRSLPLLGAKYADYYQQAKTQATVFEMLTEQYELAKVQEAKEIPSVKILDPGRVPERKSFPPILRIMFSGTFLAFCLTAIWVLGEKSWSEVDPTDSRKVLALEIAATLQSHAPWASQNGDAPETWSQRIWSRFRSQRPPI
jgi:uncharacterized protein involved in exopolysaccharide biosynthesis